jgi:hypothetical protein
MYIMQILLPPPHAIQPVMSMPVRVFSKYILAVMADKSDEEIQIMEGFTSTSDSDRRCESIIWPNGMF